jgi:hypothetical protein
MDQLQAQAFHRAIKKIAHLEKACGATTSESANKNYNKWYNSKKKNKVQLRNSII